QAERIAGEINRRPAVLPERQMKFFVKLPEWILGIKLEREIFVSGESHRHKSAANVQISTRLRKAMAWRRLTSNAQLMLSTLNYQLSTGSWRLHKLDCCPIRVANVDDSLPGVRSRFQDLRLSNRFPTRCCNRAQHSVKIIYHKRHVHRYDIARSKIDTFSVGRGKVLE